LILDKTSIPEIKVAAPYNLFFGKDNDRGVCLTEKDGLLGTLSMRYSSLDNEGKMIY
jgi:hypothetical protein